MDEEIKKAVVGYLMILAIIVIAKAIALVLLLGK